MTYRPKKNSRKASGLALAAAIVSVLCFCFSPYLPAPVVYQLAGLVLAVVALQIYMKFVQSDYEYRVTANDLEIYKLTGKKSTPVCSARTFGIGNRCDERGLRGKTHKCPAKACHFFKFLQKYPVGGLCALLFQF